MHVEADDWIGEALSSVPRPGAVVEIGSLNINGSVRKHFYGTRYIGIDLQAGPCVDVEADGCDYVPGFTPDLVISAEALEHCSRPRDLVQNAVRMVKPGGYVVLTCAGPEREPHSGVDGGSLRDGEWYRGVTAEEILAWGAEVGARLLRAEVSTQRGDVYVMLQARA